MRRGRRRRLRKKASAVQAAVTATAAMVSSCGIFLGTSKFETFDQAYRGLIVEACGCV
jgi:hypothetical protein